MARVQLVIPDEDRDRFVHAARQDGVTLSAWLRDAARARLREREAVRPFESEREVDAFFLACDAMEGAGREPDWEEHLAVIERSRASGFAES